MSDASRVVARMRSGFRACYNRGLVANPNLSGTISLKIAVGPGGEASVVEASSSRNLPASVVECVKMRAKGARFAPPKGGHAVVEIPVSFVKQGVPLAGALAQGNAERPSDTRPKRASPAQAPGGSVSDASRVVARMRSGFRACYNRGLVANPNLSGTISLKIAVGRGGEASAVEASSSGNLPASVVECVTVRAKGARFSPPKGGHAVVEIPVSFVKQGVPLASALAQGNAERPSDTRPKRASPAQAPGGSVSDASRVVARMRSGFRACYNRGLVANPNLSGTISLKIAVGPGGEASVVEASSSRNLPASVVECVKVRAKGARFAPPKGGHAVVEIPVSFVKQ